MIFKFTKLALVCGLLFIGIDSAHCSDDLQQEVIVKNKPFQIEVFKLIEWFYDTYDSYNDELECKKNKFFEKDYLTIVEIYFESFTYMNMTQWVRDYFNDHVKSSLKTGKKINIYDPIYSILSIFSEAVMLSDEYKLPTVEDEKTLSAGQITPTWFYFIEGLRPIIWDLIDKSKVD